MLALEIDSRREWWKCEQVKLPNMILLCSLSCLTYLIALLSGSDNESSSSNE